MNNHINITHSMHSDKPVELFILVVVIYVNKEYFCFNRIFKRIYNVNDY